MADPFLGEIRLFAFNFAPDGWAFCDGQLLPIAQNTALFSLLGTTYGERHDPFCAPGFKGRVAVHRGTDFPIGENGGEVPYPNGRGASQPYASSNGKRQSS